MVSDDCARLLSASGGGGVAFCMSLGWSSVLTGARRASATQVLPHALRSSLRGGAVRAHHITCSMMPQPEDNKSASAATAVVSESHSAKTANGENGRSPFDNGAAQKRLDQLRFESTFVDELPEDREKENYVRRVSGAAFTRVKPTAPWEDDQASKVGVASTAARDTLRVAAWSPSCAQMLELATGAENAAADGAGGDAAYHSLLAEVFGGATLLPSMQSYSQCYGGHQFGNWAEQLGDGRAITLGEVVTLKGERYEIQLKGAGKTPYSRFADGRAVMRSSVREFLCSEAMHFLGIPTTRALCLVSTGAKVVRDQFYNGNIKLEPGAVVCRVAPSFLRIGSLELPAYRNDLTLLRAFADYLIRHHYPSLLELPSDFEAEHNRYRALLREVIERTAHMVALWQANGFVHGVGNTDNYSLLGLTIDYGPYGFLDAYDPTYTPNTTDLPGRRYCYGRQPHIALWNLLQCAQSMVSLMGVAAAQAELERFEALFDERFSELLRRKLGLRSWRSEGDGDDNDRTLANRLMNLMAKDKVDFTNCWRALSRVRVFDGDGSGDAADADGEAALSPLKAVLHGVTDAPRRAEWVRWLRDYSSRVRSDAREGRGGDDEADTDEHRAERMNRANPKYILRNYLAQQAIEGAENDDFSEVHTLLKLLQRPFDEQPEMERYAAEAPAWAQRPGVCVNSCSS